MINLLSPHDKKQLHAARRNTIWARYTLLIIAVLVSINIILGATAFLIQSQTTESKKKLADNEQQRDQKYQQTKAEAETFRKNLATAKTILDNETTYSNIIIKIASVIPSGCVMGSLNLTPQSFGTVQSLNFSCKTPDEAVGLKTAMESHPEVFGEVNIISVSSANTASAYPISVVMSTIIQKALIQTKTGGAS